MSLDIDLYEDKEIESLKEQIRFLELEISMTASEKAEVEKQILEYERLYTLRVGDLVEKLLERRKERLRNEAKKDTTKAEEFKQAEKDYDDFKTSYEESKKIEKVTLNEDEQIEIKSKFKKACKLCHPDKVADEYKEDAHKIFVQLRHAYDRNDLKKVSEILEQLEKGIFKMGSESITGKEKLQLLHNNLKRRLEEIRNELRELKKSEAYKIISSLKDYDSHFLELRNQLTTELNKS